MNKYQQTHMDMAYLISRHSYCKKRKVGAVLVKDNRVIATGYNGTLPGAANVCEDINFNTIETVIHAEDNLLRFCGNNSIATDGCDLYVTLMPCNNCARKIINAGIKNVYYSTISSSSSGTKDILWSHAIGCKAL